MKDIKDMYVDIFQDKTILGKIFIGIPLAVLVTIFTPIILLAAIISIPFVVLTDSKFMNIIGRQIKKMFYK